MRLFWAALAVWAASPCADAAPPSRLDMIRARGTLQCGLAPAMPGFSVVHDERHARGLDADLCRATAAAIFGTADAARFVALETVDQFLADDGIDLVFHGLTAKSVREARWGVSFAATSFDDGQAIVVRSDGPVRTAAQLTGQSVCAEAGTIFAGRLARARHDIRVLALPDAPSARRAFLAGRCAGWTWDASSLFSSLVGPDAGRYRILPGRFSHEPLAPIVRRSDGALAAVLSATIGVLKSAEMGAVAEPQVAGLRARWSRAVLTRFGDYGALYRLNLTGAERVAMDRFIPD